MARYIAVLLTAVLTTTAMADAPPAASAPTRDVSLKLRYADFDPLADEPEVPALLSMHALRGGSTDGVYIVQFNERPHEAQRTSIRAAGGRLHKYLADNAYVVGMTRNVRRRVEAMPFVRWVGAFHPAYRLDEVLVDALQTSTGEPSARRYNIQVFERGLPSQQRVAQHIVELGGAVKRMSPSGFRMEATLTPPQLLEIVRRPEIAFIDIWTPAEADMDIVREATGANFIEQAGGYTGAGVAGEVLDLGVLDTHCDLTQPPIIFHTSNGAGINHGTSIMGILFGDGTCDPLANGMLPDAQPIFAALGEVTDPYAHTAELVDPQGPYRAVFQSRSVGSARTAQYTTVSAEVDDVLFTHDLLATQAQGNGPFNESRPEAWAKNIVSVGGVIHQDTLETSDDCWCGAGSSGPAADGRIKPDLIHFYDSIRTISGGCDNCYATFGGTSASTPIVTGCFGLFYQMWSDGIFGNVVDPHGAVFDNRSHMTTAKAMLINHAAQYPFDSPGHDFSRVHQGWGRPDVRNVYERRLITIAVDESDLLTEGQSATYDVTVGPTAPALRATLVYADPAGAPFSTQHRINDLTLRVVSPSGTIYWGNHGLLDGNWSTPDGAANTIDTVENVFVEAPEAGSWTVEVIASEINEDGHVETPAIDADFALIVSGVERPVRVNPIGFSVLFGDHQSGDVPDLFAGDDTYVVVEQRPAFSVLLPLVRVDVDGLAWIYPPSEVEVTLEAAVNSLPVQPPQRLSLYDFLAGVFETVDERTATFDDSVVTVTITEDAERFVAPNSTIMIMRLEWFDPGAVFSPAWSARIDQAVWTVTP